MKIDVIYGDFLNKAADVVVFPHWEGETPSKTVGGLIMEVTGRVPSPGETVHTEGLKFTVLGSDERQIKRVQVESVLDDAGEDES